MALNFGLLDPNAPAAIANSVAQGRQEAMREQMAQQQLRSNALQQESTQQQLKTGALQQEMSGLQLEQAKRERDALAKMQAQFVANGKTPDMRSNFQEMVQSGIPHFMDIGIKGMQALDRQDRVSKILGGGETTGMPATTPTGMPAPSIMRQPAAPTQNALGTGTYGIEPSNALAPTAGAYKPTMPRNAMALPANEQAAMANEYRIIEQLHMAGEHELAKSREQRLKLKSEATSPLNKLIAEQAALPPSDPMRKIYEARILKEATHAPATTVNVSTEKKYGEAFGGKLADVDIGKMTTAEKAPQMAESANRIIDLVKQGNVFTGPIADVKLNIARALNVAGASNEEKIANTEMLIAGTGQSTLDAIKGAGLGTGQGFTDKDLKFLQGIAGGTIGLTQKTLMDLATLQHRVATRSAESWNKRVGEMPKEVVQGTGLSTAPIKVPALSSVMGNTARPAGVGIDWTLHRDAAGNTAWVSPDRKSFKEAQ
jgi:hypothetical protein